MPQKLHKAVVFTMRWPTVKRLMPGVLVILVGITVGYIAVSRTHAATYAVTSEAETGTNTGNFELTNDTGASNLSSVKFGKALVPPPVPTGVKAFTGGDSIALVWPAKYYDNAWVKNYNVYRNGVKVASTVSDANGDGLKNGTQYIDTNIAPGQTYSYQVETVTLAKTISAKSVAISATVPTSTTPVPKVTLDASINQYAPNLIPWLQAYGVPAIKTWYPKHADLFARPSYVPIAEMIVKTYDQATFDSKFPGSAAVTLGNIIYIDPDVFTRNKAFAYSAMVHESTHILQYYKSGIFNGPTPRWFVEGMASYTEYETYNEYPYDDADILNVLTPANSYYTDRYVPSANFLRWLQKTYNPTYIRDANVASQLNTYGSAFVSFPGNLNIDQAWGKFRGVTTRTGEFRSALATNKCLDDTSAKMDIGNRIILYTCNGNYAQRLTYHPKPDSSNAIITVLGQCLEAANSATANGTIVWISYCNNDIAGQEWVKQSNGTIINPNSGRCLEINGGNKNTADNAVIGIWDCNGGAWQKWTIPN